MQSWAHKIEREIPTETGKVINLHSCQATESGFAIDQVKVWV